MASLENDVIEVIVEQLGIDKSDVTPEKSFVDDLNVDSLDRTELLMSLEERFHCEISEEEAADLKTVGDVITFLQKRSV